MRRPESRMNFVPPLRPRPRPARSGGPARLAAGGRQSRAGRRAVRRAGAVRPHHRRAGRRAQASGSAPRLDRPRCRCSAPGSASACSPSCCGVLVALHADRLAHRRRQAVLTDYFEHVLQLPLSLPRRHAFRPADEGDAHRHRLAVVAVARLLPRAFRGVRLADRAAAAVAVPELAARAAADRAVRASSRC